METTADRAGRTADLMRAALASLKRARLRATAGRIAILQVLHADPMHRHSLSALTQAVLAQGTPVSAGAIARAIRDLEHHGLVARHWTRGGKSAYWLKASDHGACTHQIVCRHCGRDFSINDPAFHVQLERLAMAHGIDIADQSVSIQLTCSECALVPADKRYSHHAAAARRFPT